MPVKDLDSYRETLVNLRSRLRGEIPRMIDAVNEDISASGNLSHMPVHLADQAADGVDTELHLLANEQEMLLKVEDALARIENGSFGDCQRCEKPIAEPRLQAIPYTEYCVQCASAVEMENAS